MTEVSFTDGDGKQWAEGQYVCSECGTPHHPLSKRAIDKHYEPSDDYREITAFCAPCDAQQTFVYNSTDE